ncbi:MAG: DUF5683 domain-containing protein [Bacteroidota bacterium]|nr:DUF5683 domain-containing protein [Bacteroidota bacterium]MDP4225029.1 DUF5683 domain-containing protein [Bacteroidota bacterium]
MIYRKLHIITTEAVCAVLILLLSQSVGYSQSINKDSISQTQTDTIQPKNVHSPAKASLMSAILPGLGQAYNKKYWKIPILYGGIGTLIYYIRLNNREYNKYENSYIALTNPQPGYSDAFNGTKSSDELKFYKEYYRRWRDLSWIILSGTYVLNIIDATVDAHFFNFEISDDLSLKISPSILPIPNMATPSLGITCSINF